MVARLLRNPRRGNLAEDLGVHLLRGIATVAEVLRQEDVGLDAVCNLLRLADDGMYYAEDAFYVQLKAVSVNQIEYDELGVTWLCNQTLPIFIGRVSMTDSSISLYSTIHVRQALFSWSATRAVLHVESPPVQQQSPWRGAGEDRVDVWLGDPVAEWTAKEIGDCVTDSKVYPVLKRFLEIERQTSEFLRFGQISNVSWRTNDADSMASELALIKGSTGDFVALLERCRPALQSLLLNIPMREADDERRLAVPLVALVAGLRQLGALDDPDGVLDKLCQVGILMQPRSSDAHP
jgi:hypothetical protein